MEDKSHIVYEGSKFIIEWYFDQNKKSIAKEFFSKEIEEIQNKFLVLVKRMGDFGKIFDKTKFRHENDGIYAFKPQPDRYLSFFTDEKKIIITNGFRKKTDKLPKNEKNLAMKYRQEYFERKNRGEKI